MVLGMDQDSYTDMVFDMDHALTLTMQAMAANRMPAEKSTFILAGPVKWKPIRTG